MFKWCLLCVLFRGAAFGFELTSPLFDRLDLAELQQVESEREKSADSSSAFQLDGAILHYFFAEAFALRLKFNKSDHFLSLANHFCEEVENSHFRGIEQPSLKSRSALLCALVQAERINRQSPLAQLATAARIQSDLETGKQNDPDASEILYVEGRVFGSLPPAFGQNFRRALVSLTMFTRRRPDLSVGTFLLGRTYYWQGNVRRARELFESCENSRTPFFFRDGYFIDEKIHNDGIASGLYPGIFHSPAQGFGARLAFIDEVFPNTHLFGSLAIASRPLTEFEMGIRTLEKISAGSLGYALTTQFFYGIEDFYGVGASAPSVNQSEFTAFRGQVRAQVFLLLSPHFFAKGGVQTDFSFFTQTDGVAFAPFSDADRNSAEGYGPFAELGWDSRDSEELPLQGSLFSVREFLAFSFLGTPRPFEQTHLEASVFNRVANQHSIGVRLFFDFLSDSAPLGAFPRLNGAIRLPAVVQNRYTDKSLAAGYVEYTGRIWGPVNLLIFTSALQMGADFFSQFSQPILYGAGGGFDVSLSRFRSDHLRIEAGVFNSEFGIRVFGGKRF